jgi:hypothetical protein
VSQDASLTPAPAPAKREPIFAQRIEVIVSGLIGLLALFVSAYTVYVQRQQLKVQAWPRLTLELEADRAAPAGRSRATLLLRNRGVAPAEIRAMRLSLGGRDMTDWLDWLTAVGQRQGVKTISFDEATTPVGMVLGVGQDLVLLGTESLPTQAMLNADAESSIDVCYCSVLDDCWVLTIPPARGRPTTKAVAECPKYPAFLGASESQANEWARAFLERATHDADADAGDAN